MRVSRIRVTGLFGVFDHNVPVRRGERVTIIAGPNGYGKTILLRLIDSVFNGNNHRLRSVPFRRLQIDFDDASSLSVQKSAGSSKAGSTVTFGFRDGGHEHPDWTLPSIDEQRHGAPLELIDRYVPELERVDRAQWRFLPTGEILAIDEVVDRFSVFLGPLFGETKSSKRPEWLDDLRSRVHVRLIETQRLQSSQAAVTPRSRSANPAATRWAVTTYAGELASLIQARLAEYATISQGLDRTFPLRVVSRQVPVELSTEELRRELSAIEQRRAELTEDGLLVAEAGPAFTGLDEIQDEMKPVIVVWIEDVKAKFDVLNDLAARTRLLKRLINSRFLFKEMVVGPEFGFSFKTPGGDTLSPDLLSSGEQHELVLVYELLFKVESPALIMIDEPELSLHVAWQKVFLRDLQEVAGLGDFDVILATHSPQIIGDRLDVTVELQGPRALNAHNNS